MSASVSGLRPFQFDDATPMNTYVPKRHTISVGRMLLISALIAAFASVAVFSYYRAKADTFDNSVVSNVQSASQVVSTFVAANPSVTTFDTSTAGLVLPSTNGTQFAITGLGGKGAAVPGAYEIHGWNPKANTYSSATKYWAFISTTGAYKAGGSN